MKRVGTPIEVASAVIYFCSEEAAFVTGQTLSVSGGLTMSWLASDSPVVVGNCGLRLRLTIERDDRYQTISVPAEQLDSDRRSFCRQLR